MRSTIASTWGRKPSTAAGEKTFVQKFAQAGVFRRIHKNHPQAQHAREIGEFSLATRREGDDHLLRAFGGKPRVFGDGGTFGVAEDSPDRPLAAHVDEM